MVLTANTDLAMREFFYLENAPGYAAELRDRLELDRLVVGDVGALERASSPDVERRTFLRWILDGISPERLQLPDPDADDPEEEEEEEE